MPGRFPNCQISRRLSSSFAENILTNSCTIFVHYFRLLLTKHAIGPPLLTYLGWNKNLQLHTLAVFPLSLLKILGEGQLNYFRIFPGWISNSSRFSGVVDFRGLLQMRDKKQSLTAARHSKFAITLVSDGSSTNGKVG